VIATVPPSPVRLAPARTATAEPWFLVTMTLIGSFGIAASTIYVPSVPAIASALGAPIAGVQLTFAAYLGVFAAGMPIVGPLSDRYGRRRVLLYGLVLSIAGSVLCAASPSLGALIAARAVQALGACAGLVVGRALIRDRYPREEAARIIAGLSFTITLAQALAPVAGSHLARWGGWRASFVAVALLAGVALLLALRHIPGSASATRTEPQPFRPGESYSTLITGRRFLAYTLAATGASAGFQLFSAGGAAVLVGGLGVSPEAFGYYAMLPPAGFLVGSFLARRLTPRLGVDGMIACGGAVLVASVTLMLVLALGGVTTPLAIVGPMVVVCCGSGLLTPNAVAGALSVKPEIGGTASGLLSFIQLGGAASATFVLSRLDSHSAVALSGVIAICAAAGIGAFALLTPGQRPLHRLKSSGDLP